MADYPITPNKFRNLKRKAREARDEYRGARKTALVALAHARTVAEKYARYRADADAEDALTTCWNARKDYYGMLHILRKARVEVGAAWSPRGLDNVRRSNASR
jgi:hypothetical protein